MLSDIKTKLQKIGASYNMSIKTFVAVDLGAESGRVFLGEIQNKRKLEITEIHRFFNGYITINGRKKWDIMNLFKEIKQGIKKAVKESKTHISGIGIDTWGVDFGLFDKDGEICMLPYQYRDEAFIGSSEEVYDSIDKSWLFSKAGIQSMDINTLFQLYTATKFNSSALENAKTLLFIPDIFNYWLTGKMKTEYTIASTSQLIDVKKKTWLYDVAEKLSIPTKIFPEIAESGTELGCLTDEIKKELEINYDIPVFSVASHDTASAVVSIPFESPHSCFISCGTWSLIGKEIPSPVLTKKAEDLNYTNEGGVFNTIRFLKNISGLWIIQECKRHWKKEGLNISYGDMVDEASRIAPFTQIINPNDSVFVTAGNMPQKIQDFCQKTNQNIPKTVGEIIRTVIDSLALCYKESVENIALLTGTEIETVHMVGGGIKNNLLCQLTANITGKKVITGPTEGTVEGNILIQAISNGEIENLATAREIVKHSEDIKIINPKPMENIQKVYERYLKLENN